MPRSKNYARRWQSDRTLFWTQARVRAHSTRVLTPKAQSVLISRAVSAIESLVARVETRPTQRVYRPRTKSNATTINPNLQIDIERRFVAGSVLFIGEITAHRDPILVRHLPPTFKHP